MSTAAAKAARPVLDQIRKACKRRGVTGLKGLISSFKLIDANDDLKVTPDEIDTWLQNYGIVLSKDELAKIVAAFDRDGDGLVGYSEFAAGLRGGLNKRRSNAVRAAFEKLDRTGDGVVDATDLRLAYDVSEHPAVRAGTLTEDQALAQTLEAFDDADHPDGVVTWGEFEAYYTGLSATVDNDDYFELLLHNTWRVGEPLPPRRGGGGGGGGGAPADTQTMRELTAMSARRADTTGGNTRFLTSLEGPQEVPAGPKPAKRIVGYTGHVPGAQDTFGEGFARVEERAAVPARKPPLPLPPFKDEASAFVRKGNLANAHSFRLE